MAGLTMPDAELEARILLSPPVTQAVEEVVTALEAEAMMLALDRDHDTGHYATESIRIVEEAGPNRRIRAADDRADGYLPVILARGSGIYGPNGRPIVPKKPGGRLVWRDRATGALIFARSVKGRKPTHAMRDAGRNVAERLGLRWIESS